MHAPSPAPRRSLLIAAVIAMLLSSICATTTAAPAEWDTCNDAVVTLFCCSFPGRRYCAKAHPTPASCLCAVSEQ